MSRARGDRNRINPGRSRVNTIRDLDIQGNVAEQQSGGGSAAVSSLTVEGVVQSYDVASKTAVVTVSSGSLSGTYSGCDNATGTDPLYQYDVVLMRVYPGTGESPLCIQLLNRSAEYSYFDMSLWPNQNVLTNQIQYWPYRDVNNVFSQGTDGVYDSVRDLVYDPSDGSLFGFQLPPVSPTIKGLELGGYRYRCGAELGISGQIQGFSRNGTFFPVPYPTELDVPAIPVNSTSYVRVLGHLVGPNGRFAALMARVYSESSPAPSVTKLKVVVCETNASFTAWSTVNVIIDDVINNVEAGNGDVHTLADDNGWIWFWSENWSVSVSRQIRMYRFRKSTSALSLADTKTQITGNYPSFHSSWPGYSIFSQDYLGLVSRVTCMENGNLCGQRQLDDDLVKMTIWDGSGNVVDDYVIDNNFLSKTYQSAGSIIRRWIGITSLDNKIYGVGFEPKFPSMWPSLTDSTPFFVKFTGSSGVKLQVPLDCPGEYTVLTRPNRPICAATGSKIHGIVGNYLFRFES